MTKKLFFSQINMAFLCANFTGQRLIESLRLNCHNCVSLAVTINVP